MCVLDMRKLGSLIRFERCLSWQGLSSDPGSVRSITILLYRPVRRNLRAAADPKSSRHQASMPKLVSQPWSSRPRSYRVDLWISIAYSVVFLA